MEIWKKDRLYSFLRVYLDACTRRCYSRFRVRGLENIPKNGAVLIAPNHCGTLMDPLVVLSTRRKPMSFGCRADMFKKPIVAGFLRFCKVVPIVRARDGIRNVEKNRQTMEEIYDIISHGVPFCIFPEGTHRPKHSLLPIKKGIARIALTADERFGDSQKVYIVPCGIEYGDYFHFRTTCRVVFGKPLDIRQIKADNPGLGEAEMHALIQEKVKDGISHLITYLEDDESYDERWKRWESRREARPGWGWFSLMALLSPLFVLSCILAAPQLIAAKCFLKNIKDKAFSNTVRFLTKFVGTPVAFILWMVLAALFSPKGWITVLLAFCVLEAHNFFYDYIGFIRMWLKARKNKKQICPKH